MIAFCNMMVGGHPFGVRIQVLGKVYHEKESIFVFKGFKIGQDLCDALGNEAFDGSGTDCQVLKN